MFLFSAAQMSCSMLSSGQLWQILGSCLPFLKLLAPFGLILCHGECMGATMSAGTLDLEFCLPSVGNQLAL